MIVFISDSEMNRANGPEPEPTDEDAEPPAKTTSAEAAGAAAAAAFAVVGWSLRGESYAMWV